MADYQLF